MDIKEKEELIKLVNKYLEETRQKVKKWGHLESCPYIEKLNTISKVERLDYADLWTYGFPCQDISLAGKKQGIVKGKTRSGLLHEVERLLEVAKEERTLPKYLILENVKNLLSERFKGDFEKWVEYLSDLGYETKWEKLTASDYGIPQKRERESLRYQSEKTFTGDSGSQNLFLSEFSIKTC